MKVDLASEEIAILSLLIRVHLKRAPANSSAVSVVRDLLTKLESTRSCISQDSVKYLN